MKTIYDECVELGIEIDNHYSDLYIPVTSQTAELVKKYKHQHEVFKNQIDGKFWYQVYFQYQPFWDAVQAERERRKNLPDVK